METNGEFAIERFGRFNETEVTGIVDRTGACWFTEDMLADALEIDRTTVLRIREHHPEEFAEGADYRSAVVAGKRRTLYSEEGFLTVCDISTSKVAYRLRRWMRQQFRVKQRSDGVVVQARGVPRDDLSDLGADLAYLQGMLNAMAEDRRRIAALDRENVAIRAEQGDLRERLQSNEQQLATLLDGTKVKPGEMTAIELARHCRWVSGSGAPHNLAVILAAANEGFVGKAWMARRTEQGPAAHPGVEVWVFTPVGVAEFLARIDARYSTGQRFEVVPNAVAARELGQVKNKRSVLKT